ncbi:hypothetical protein M3Y94_00231700 [Aphelenchoides besseyi]|nr:hypothetical protein M3Y94_00231700 [Aphelenchoides besseyi]KAI6236433.1 hypothetical protein M3Y95_00157100 [Aphelenchoides besseyi]
MTSTFLLLFCLFTIVNGYPYYNQPNGQFGNQQPFHYPQQQMPFYQNGNPYGQQQAQWPNNQGMNYPYYQQPQGMFGNPNQNAEQDQEYCECKFIADVKRCFKQDEEEYFMAFVSIKNNPKLTKSESVKRAGKLFKRLDSSIQTCYSKAKSADGKRLQQRKKRDNQILSRLSNETRDLAKYLRKYENDEQLTAPQLDMKIREALKKASPNAINELLQHFPEYRRLYSSQQYQPFYQQPYSGGYGQMFG